MDNRAGLRHPQAQPTLEVTLPNNGKQSLGLQGVAVVVAVVLAVTYLATYAMRKYATAAEAATLLAVIVGPLVGLGAAAFGIKLSADAKAETARTKDETADAAAELSKLTTPPPGGGDDGGRAVTPAPALSRQDLDPVIERLRRISR